MKLYNKIIEIADRFHLINENVTKLGCDIDKLLEYTRIRTMISHKLLHFCNNDGVLLVYYLELSKSLKCEDFIKASEYKELINKYEPNV